MTKKKSLKFLDDTWEDFSAVIFNCIPILLLGLAYLFIDNENYNGLELYNIDILPDVIFTVIWLVSSSTAYISSLTRNTRLTLDDFESNKVFIRISEITHKLFYALLIGMYLLVKLSNLYIIMDNGIKYINIIIVSILLVLFIFRIFAFKIRYYIYGDVKNYRNQRYFSDEKIIIDD